MRDVLTESLRSGASVSCGCFHVDGLVRHNRSYHPAYYVWKGMIDRCSNPKAKDWHNYGGRGIKVCDQWKDDPTAFCDWAESNGHKKGLQIDRIDNFGDYEPANCHFVTPKVNSRNKRNNSRLSAFGEAKTLSTWAEDQRCVVSYGTLCRRIQKGVSPEEAIMKPVCCLGAD